jgi:hypothetical protein
MHAYKYVHKCKSHLLELPLINIYKLCQQFDNASYFAADNITVWQVY